MASRILLGMLTTVFLVGCRTEPAATADLKGKKVLIVIAKKNFRDEEFREPSNLLKKCGASVTVACSSLEESRGMLGATVKPDILLKDAKASDYDAIVFVGGMGASEYFDDPTAQKLAQDAVSAGKILCAICIAPATLARAGVLKGKRAACYPSVKDDLVRGGAEFTGSPVEQDGNIITARGPDAARKFANAIVNALSQK